MRLDSIDEVDVFTCVHQDLSLVDAGTYTCMATNRLGKAEAVGTLLVLSK